MLYAAALVSAFGFVYVLVPIITRLAVSLSFVDQPNARKIHSRPIPLMGGLAIFIGCAVTVLLFHGTSRVGMVLVLGGSLLVMTGLLDDWFKTKKREFPVWPRILIYTLASMIPAAFGIRVEGITDWSGGGMLLFPVWFSWLATMLWVFALTNMVNFIDGLDGLATGIATISSFTLLATALIKGQPDSAVLAAILAGACAAFLLYNFYPAKVFMGDAGAIFIGYSLAVLAVDGAFKSATLVSLFVPVLALGVPIMDTVVVFTRRALKRQGLHRADKLHTHHSLMQWGLTQTQTVSFLYLIGAFFSLLSLVILLAFT
ncbi:MraY family glycosyltransferase [Paenibacillus sp. y28]|uniref:MraY family glycosyltransferase n=1 Tax=Paenibacillus sp. y28 TaxID=3129110 RepID=UPI00301765E4